MRSSPVRMSARGGRTAWKAWVAAAVLATFAIAVPVLAVAPVPAPGVAVIDGNPSEWTAADFFSDMKHEGSSHVVASVSVRYDCSLSTLSVFVDAGADVSFLADRPENAYVRIDGVGKLVSGESGSDGTPPEFVWVGRSGSFAQGYEASGIVAPGDHTIRVHVLMSDDSEDGGYLTIDSEPRTGPLTLACDDGSEAPAASGSSGTSPGTSPTGGVDAATGAPPTPPPTDTVAWTTGPWAITAFWLVIIALGLIDGAALVGLRVRNR